MTLRQVLEHYAAGHTSAQTAQDEAKHAVFTLPRRQWREASSKHAEDAIKLRQCADLAAALALLLDGEDVLDREIPDAKMELLQSLYPEMAIALASACAA